ncbi:hypothetical protein FACS1894132_11400 [Clostridia bacterium]|nr:hypothetical protein FACS1894132_11400 [Clostridia bacterium]
MTNIEKLVDIVKTLRSPNGCPWDIEQTHKSCKSGLIEESYEAAEAIDKNDFNLLKEELGDVLLQVVFHSQIAQENGEFNFDDVCMEIVTKLVVRHPHVFGNVRAENADDVLKNWDKNKKEKKSQTYTDTLKDVPISLPALMRAQKIGKRAANANLDFQVVDDTISALESEIIELKSAISDNSNIAEEIGDVLFSVVNIARHLKIDAEDALLTSTNKFIDRFEKVECAVKKDGFDLQNLSAVDLDTYWINAKAE